MNIYKYFMHPEQLDGYTNRIRIPEIAYNAARNGEITWKQAEPYIVKDPKWAYLYALNVLKCRWPEAERYIMKDPKWAYFYASLVLKRRWPKAEPYIMKDPWWAYRYTADVLNRRWPEAEPYIMKDPGTWAEYKQVFNL